MNRTRLLPLLLCLCFALSLALAGHAHAADYDALTLKQVKDSGAAALTADQAKALLQGRVVAEMRNWTHTMRFFDDGKLKVEGCKRGNTCSQPGKASGAWSVDPSGVVHIRQGWSGDAGGWSGLLYPMGGKHFLFPAKADGDAPWSYCILK